jgi:hypothetical protein
MKIKYLSVLGILLLAACAASPKEYSNLLGSWVGQPVNHLLATWGEPERVTPLQGDYELFEYVNRTNVAPAFSLNYHPAYNQSRQYAPMPQYLPTGQTCLTRFWINPNGIVRDWEWQGNACPRSIMPE